jgi:deoxyribodipyrimidine photo-lyase
MRPWLQLNRTGFMHNRLRMVTASFLTKDLGIDWRAAKRYFALQLNDYELSSNNGGWQWAASTGCDAQPWFRIFNPVTQSQKFDRTGPSFAVWLPQLAGSGGKDIHAPWLAETGCWNGGGGAGADYPLPVVEHGSAAERTLEARPQAHPGSGSHALRQRIKRVPAFAGTTCLFW